MTCLWLRICECVCVCSVSIILWFQLFCDYSYRCTVSLNIFNPHIILPLFWSCVGYCMKCEIWVNILVWWRMTIWYHQLSNLVFCFPISVVLSFMMKAVDGKFCSLRVYLHYNVSMDMLLRNAACKTSWTGERERERKTWVTQGLSCSDHVIVVLCH